MESVADKRWSVEQQALINEAYADLLNSAVYCQSEESRLLIKRAFSFADSAHYPVTRKSGEPYILHPIAVAKLVSNVLPGDAESIACALLHDVVEDTQYTVDDVKEEFSPSIAVIVNGLTKIDKFVESSDTKQTVNFQKLINTIEDDFRTIFIKLADRLHNMQTLSAMQDYKQKRIASETAYFYAPIAERLGLYDFKTQLEDLAFRYQSPEEYAEIEQKLQLSKEQFVNRINSFARPISAKLMKSGMEFTVSSRSKSIYSIWRKMQKKGVAFEEIYDLLAMRIVFTPKEGIPEKTQCWFIYTVLTDIYTVLEDRTRDWVSTPKVNGYEALQCTLLSKSGNWIEVQIRTDRMNAIAEHGLAAHWKYKGSNYSDSYAKLFESLRAQVTRAQSAPYRNSVDYVSNIQASLLMQQICVYDENRKEYEISRQSTVLDFAYMQSVQKGNEALGAKVDGKFRQLNGQLRGGEVVEILTARSQMPSKKWLDFVRTSLAKSCINQSILDQRRALVETGRRRVMDLCGQLRGHVDEVQLNEVLPKFDVLGLEELYVGVALGDVNLRLLRRSLQVDRMQRIWRNAVRQCWQSSFRSRRSVEVVRDSDGQRYEIFQSPCCCALPGDEALVFRRDDHSAVAHRTLCNEAVRLMAQHEDKMIRVTWDSSKSQLYTAQFYLEGRDGEGLLESLFKSIGAQISVDVHKVDMESDGFSFKGVISVRVRNLAELNTVMQAANRVPGVLRVSRVLSLAQ